MAIDVVPPSKKILFLANFADCYPKANTRQLSLHTALISRMKSLQSPFIPPSVFTGGNKAPSNRETVQKLPKIFPRHPDPGGPTKLVATWVKKETTTQSTRLNSNNFDNPAPGRFCLCAVVVIQIRLESFFLPVITQKITG